MTLDDFEIFILDFDGVLTNDRVFIDSNGVESVVCNRRDGLAFDVLRKLKKKVYILSTEKNNVVAARATKLKVPAIYGVANKSDRLIELFEELGVSGDKACYLGNDLNDLRAMDLCLLKVAPNDAHPLVKNIADIIVTSNGGEGVLRELMEIHFKLNFVDILYG